jgi:hypothetical protein
MQALELLNSDDSIRKIWHGGECFYSALDVVMQRLEMNKKQAQNYYHVLKRRMLIDGEPLNSVQIKAKCDDGEYYLTDFVNIISLNRLSQTIEISRGRRYKRVDFRKDDEVVNFHPLVIRYFEAQNFTVEHHEVLPSGKVVDLIAVLGSTTYAVECKPYLSIQKFYTAVGQILSYCTELSASCRPAIACYRESIDRYIINTCEALNIVLIPIDALTV